MIDNLRGLASLFDRTMGRDSGERVTALALRLVQADMGAAAAQRHMSESYHAIVNEAKRWLRDAARTHDARFDACGYRID